MDRFLTDPDLYRPEQLLMMSARNSNGDSEDCLVKQKNLKIKFLENENKEFQKRLKDKDKTIQINK